ncbi:pentatricopeptide repeat-containing protein At1g06143-like [Olea europaea var. sylvestris]|uniref:pentatricopeptide repeat-containing protein At1g06143-like n=1 Tax=Olea europaea var. sylvestris TaxID=158386 RepID=UPI000C1D5FD2|nr:pentatricopeptide repeat-containing protein At1g06143-like [Olea europaea var. sylvestris]XP_022884810.1 pentatricopeptide repeat-containing protein At1g06143-like [Olea europaea var. sylvestris]XP_022884816.1 pentatricopeptide repeat-containing protein At1g06143-like [Olea europaea var. sylvestris]
MKFFVVNRPRLTVAQVADRLKRCSNLKEIESFYAMMIKNDTTQNCFLVNQYITACSTFHSIDSAIFAFSQMENPNIFVYNAIVGAFVNCFRPFEALQYYIDMLRNSVYPSSYTFPAVTKSCRVLSAVGFGECVHGQVWKYGFPSHVHVLTALIDFYSSFGRVDESRMVFDEMPERDGFAWSTMIEAHASIGDLASARRLFDEMPEKNTAARNTMIHGYARVGDVNSAEELFYMMLGKDLISWTTMINCYTKSKQYSKALELFYEMKNEEVRPDEVTLSTVISACAHLGALNQGKEIHIYAMQSGFDLDVYMGSALIDMYAKCGVLERALVVFFKLQEKNLFCWNSVIDGLAVHGHAKEALVMFGRMEKEKIKPNGVTFVSILSACTHAGLVEEGRRRFFNMTHKYGILPEIEHYGCMIDLLCKAGLLEEALELIRGMRMDPNSVVWGALLGGCKLHKNLEIAQLAVDRLVVLESNSSGYYSLLVNMYAEENRWHEVARMRTIMKEHGVEKKSPGSSWIEVDKKTHQFSACDNYHPASGEIYSLLDVLDLQLKLIGYAPQYDFIL